MDKTLAILGAIGLAAFAVAAAMVATSPATVPSGATLAREFVMDDPTYRFDGIADTLQVSYDGATGTATARFTSRHAGYGDRSGMILAEVLTPHEAVIRVSGGKVASAVMDGVWDMRGQKEIGG